MDIETKYTLEVKKLGKVSKKTKGASWEFGADRERGKTQEV